ncbi:MAG: UTP--glucose-1-phosphate uridylyltransferase [Chloroflexi bacterium]|nr:UTP--glucose-1-phosphate uridylyltransferase [Chloroflexota bacterium]
MSRYSMFAPAGMGELAMPSSLNQVRKAVIPVAGLGTRLLPVTKSQPKEMLPVGRKPAVQYIVEELEAAGIRDMLLVTGRKKTAIEDHFDPDPELRQRLTAAGNTDLLELLNFAENDTAFYYVRQSTQSGNGDAVRLGRRFCGDDVFVVAFGDSIIKSNGRKSVLDRMIETHLLRHSSCTVAVERVPEEDAPKYGVVVPAEPVDERFDISDLVEKPARGTAPSNLAIAARYVFSPEIFDALDVTPPGKGGEVWLADAIRILLKQGRRVTCVTLNEGEQRYDIGNFESYYRAFVDFALADERYGYLLRQYLMRKLG